MTTHHTFRARLGRALAAALAIVGACLLALAPPAPAATVDQACNYDNATFNACLNISPAGSGWWDVRAGIDVYMPEQYAREVLACGAGFRASLWGDDGAAGPSSGDQYISSLGLAAGWPAAGPDGIAAEFGATVYWYYLDEDRGRDTDELYARISFRDCHNGLTRTFTTGTVRHDFSS